MGEDSFTCANRACATRFPIVDGIPILLNESNSIFRIDDFTTDRDTFYQSRSGGRVKRFITGWIPDCSVNVKAEGNFRTFAGALLEGAETASVLVLGGSVFNRGMECLVDDRIDLVETDVSFGARTQAIVDAHNIPFEDGSFDGVVVQAVLEHVLDPPRCVEEIHRVLKPGGLVYAETPFMQQVHAGPYDFTRFTHLGHRRLFRRFEELESGAVCGPGMALAWTYQYFLMSFFTSNRGRKFATAFAHLTAFWLKWFDPYLIDKPGCLDAASGVYLLARRSESIYPDTDLIASYRGAVDLLKPRD